MGDRIEGSHRWRNGLEFAVLGPVTVRRDGNPIALDNQQRALLAALLVAFPHSVDIERLRAQVRYTGAAAAATGRSREARSARRVVEGLQQRLEAGAAEGSGSWSATGHGCSCSSTRMRWILGVSSPRCAAGRDGAAARDAAADAYREGLRLWRGIAYAGIPRRPSPKRCSSKPKCSGDHHSDSGTRMSWPRRNSTAGSRRGRCGAEALVADHRSTSARGKCWCSVWPGREQHAHALAALRRCRAIIDDGWAARSVPPSGASRPRSSRTTPCTRIRPGVRAAEVSRIEPDGAADPPHRP